MPRTSHPPPLDSGRQEPRTVGAERRALLSAGYLNPREQQERPKKDALRALQAPLKERYCVVLQTLRSAPVVAAALDRV